MSEQPKVQAVAFTAIVDEKGYKIGLCHEGISGYTPTNFGPFKTYEEYNKKAEELNTGLGLSKAMAYAIIASTMRREPSKYLIGTIELADNTESDVIEEVMNILEEANIIYDEIETYLDIKQELPEGKGLDEAMLEKVCTILRNNKVIYQISLKEYEATGRQFEDSKSDEDY